MSKESEIFHSGKELLRRCVRKLSENQQGETGGNYALYPTVLIFMGEKSREYARYVKSTLDDNWSNARYLQYINVYKSGKKYKVYRVSNAEERNECEWDTEESVEWEDCLNKSIVSMLETDEKIFQDRNTIKMEFILDATEATAKEYYDIFAQVKSKMNAVHLKTLYIMLDQRPENGFAAASEQLLRYVADKKDDLGGTVYLLSNQMKSGMILGERKIWQNYRLVSNIVLLGGNRGKDNAYTVGLFNGVKTASYALVTKPAEEIATISLEALLQEVEAWERENTDKELSEDDIKKKLKITNENGLRFAEELYRKEIAPNLPDSCALEYLPFESKKAFKWIKKQNSMSMNEINDKTYGAWSYFMDTYYKKTVERYWNVDGKEDGCREQIREYLRNVFGYFELLRLGKQKADVHELINRKYIDPGHKENATWTEKLHHAGEVESKKIFYAKIKAILNEELDRLFECAKDFKEHYEQFQNEIRQEGAVSGDETKSIREFYGDEVKSFVRDHKKNMSDDPTVFPTVFRIPSEKEDILQAIWEIYKNLIEQEIYQEDFEGEIDRRMRDMNDVDRQAFVREELQKNLTGSIRLRSVTEASLQKTGCYYLVNSEAKYAKELAQKDGNGRDFMLYNLNRTDCIEQMEIYNIQNLKILHLVSQEEE